MNATKHLKGILLILSNNIRFYPHLDQYKLSPSFLYAIRSYVTII